MALVEHRRRPVGLEGAVGTGLGPILPHDRGHTLGRGPDEVEHHAAGTVAFREQHFAAAHHRAGRHHAEHLLVPPAKPPQHRAAGRIDDEEVIPHPGQHHVPALDAGGQRRAVTRQFGRRPPDLAAGGEVEGHQTAVEPLDEIEPFGRRRRRPRRAASHRHEHQPAIAHLQHKRGRTDAKKILHHVVGLGRVDPPQAGSVGEVTAFEPTLGPEREHAVSGDHGGRTRPTVVAEGVGVVGGITLLPEFGAGLGVQAAQPVVATDAVEDEQASRSHCRRTVALAHLAVPDDPRPRGRPGNGHALEAAAAIARGPEECAPILAPSHGQIGNRHSLGGPRGHRQGRHEQAEWQSANQPQPAALAYR